MEERPNVLLIVVDACRADYLSPYDPDVERTPAIASLAESGTAFQRAISPAPWTLPSATSLLTGEDPHEHGATSVGFAAGGRTLVDDLSDVGYRCVHVSPKTWIGEWLPQGREFDEVVEFTGPEHRRFEGGRDVRALSSGVDRGPRWYATVVRRALASETPLRSLGNAAAFKLAEATGDAWLDDIWASEKAADATAEQLAATAEDDRPRFVYVHLMDPHLPFYVPAEFASDIRPPGCATEADEREFMGSLMDDAWAIRTGERTLSDAEVAYLRARYADEVAYADSVVGEMLAALEASGLADETLVAVTADHGEHLGERVDDPYDDRAGGGDGERLDGRTLIDHQASVWLPVLRVPLVVRYPGRFDGGERDDLVQPHYLAETIRALVGLDHDRSRSLLAEDVSDLRPTALAKYDGVVRSHPPKGYADDRLFVRRTTAVHGDWKLDDVGGERRAARIDWTETEATEVAVEDLPDEARAALEATLGRVEEDGGSIAAVETEGTEMAETEPAEMPAEVEARLDDLGYM